MVIKMEPEKVRAFELQADMLAVLANSKRLMILELLGEGAKSVTQIAETLDMTLQNTSQHLRLMKEQSILKAKRDGQTVTYCLTTPIFKECCETVRKAMAEEVRKRNTDLSRSLI